MPAMSLSSAALVRASLERAATKQPRTSSSLSSPWGRASTVRRCFLRLLPPASGVACLLFCANLAGPSPMLLVASEWV
eukprot:2806812-Pyramimonas_sp.AAC.1